jgi:hypothetical protein
MKVQYAADVFAHVSMVTTTSSKCAVFQTIADHPNYHWPYYRLPDTEYTAADLGAFEHDVHRLASAWFKKRPTTTWKRSSAGVHCIISTLIRMTLIQRGTPSRSLSCRWCVRSCSWIFMDGNTKLHSRSISQSTLPLLTPLTSSRSLIRRRSAERATSDSVTTTWTRSQSAFGPSGYSLVRTACPFRHGRPTALPRAVRRDRGSSPSTASRSWSGSLARASVPATVVGPVRSENKLLWLRPGWQLGSLALSLQRRRIRLEQRQAQWLLAHRSRVQAFLARRERSGQQPSRSMPVVLTRRRPRSALGREQRERGQGYWV